MRKKIEYIKISVVTPNFNGEKFLEKTLLSVLSQNYPNLEYIVVDGKSTDSSMKIVEKYAGKLAHVITEPDRGHADAVNKGFARASGDAMAWINSDDLLAPGSLALVNEVFQDFSDVEWVTGRGASILENDALNILRDVRPWSWLRFLCGDFRHIQQEGTFWRRSLWVRAGGGLSLNYSLANDFELWTRFFLYAPLYSVDAVTGYFRHRDGQRSVAHRQQYDGESEQVLTELLNAIPISLLARYLDVLPAKRTLFPSDDFKAIPARLAVADPPVIRVDETTRRMVREAFLPSFPTADKPDETLHDLAFNGADRISWTGGPDFTSEDLAGLDVELVQSSSPAGHGVEFSDSTPPMPLLIGPLAVYELGPLQYRIQLSYTGKAIGHDIVIDKPTPSIRLRLVLTTDRYAVIVNGKIFAVGPVVGKQISQSQHAVLGGGYLSRYWAGTIKRIWVAFKSRTGSETSRLIVHHAAGGEFRRDLFERMKDHSEWYSAAHASVPSPRMKRPLPILVLDPGMKDSLTHHNVINGNLAALAAKRGRQILFVTHLLAKKESFPYEIYPKFSKSIYDDKPELDETAYQKLVQKYLDELTSHFAEMDGPVVAIVHTTTSAFIVALALLLLKEKPKLGRLSVQLMFHPLSFISRDEWGPHSHARYLSALRLLRKTENELDISVRLSTSCREFSDFYSCILGEDVPVHPYALLAEAQAGRPDHVARIHDAKPSQAARRSGVLLYAGDLKLDKGLGWISDAVATLLAENREADFYIHISENRFKDQRIDALVNQLSLSAAAFSNLKLLRGYLEQSSWDDVIGRMSIFVIPYMPESYRNKTSGVFWEYLYKAASSACMIVMNGSLMAREAKHWQLNARFCDYGDTKALSALIRETLAGLHPIVESASAQGVKPFLNAFYSQGNDEYLLDEIGE